VRAAFSAREEKQNREFLQSPRPVTKIKNDADEISKRACCKL
jgi:hypothetical protein